MNEWKCEVIKAENGYVIRYDEESENDEEYIKTRTIAIENDDEKEALSTLFIQLADYFGVQYDKFSSENLKITWDEKGDHVDD